MMFLLSRLGPVIALVVGLIASLFIGSLLGSEDYELVIIIFLGLFGLAWMITAGDRWWLPMPFAVGLGGVFYAPFKIYPHELALAACGVALLPRVFLKRANFRQGRQPVPLVVLVLLGYLLLHAAVCIAINRGDGAGLGNIGRAYMNATWGLIFGLAFYWYGSTKHLRLGFGLFYAALLIRLPLGLYNVWQGGVAFVPGINFALDEQDIRSSSNLLMVIAGLACVFGHGLPARIFNGFMAAAGGLIWLGLGGSRGQLLITFFFFAVLALIFRWRALLAGAGVAFALVAITLNLAPSIIDPLPFQTQRSLTALMWNAPEEMEVQGMVKGSSRFRQVLWEEAMTRWTESPRTITVGTGIKPWDDSNAAAAASFEVESFTLLVRHGADVGVYETGFCSMLAVTGLVGLLLFYASFSSVFSRIVRGLRTLPLEGMGKVFTAWSAGALACYFFLSFVAGLFPSFEFFLGFIALVYVETVRQAQRRETKVIEPRSALPAVAPRRLVPAGARA